MDHTSSSSLNIIFITIIIIASQAIPLALSHIPNQANSLGQ